MSKLISASILSGICFLFIALGAMSASVADTSSGDELLELFKKPRLAASFGVEPKEENYSSQDEARALSIPRVLFKNLNKRPVEGKLDEENGNYLSSLGAYDEGSTGGIDGWNYDIPFSMPIVVWEGDEPSTKQVDQDGYLIELNRYSDSEIVGYLVKEKVAYIVLSLVDKTEFQVLELAWSDRQLPYFNGYYFQISSDPVPDTRAVVFEPEFLKKLQAKLLAE